VRRTGAWAGTVAATCAAICLVVLPVTRCVGPQASVAGNDETSGRDWLESHGVEVGSANNDERLGPGVSAATSTSSVVTTTSALDVCDEGTELLEGYADGGDCVLAQSGYLDLLGRSWGCVIQGEGWVDICIVQEGPSGEGSTRSVIHMDATDAAEELGA